VKVTIRFVTAAATALVVSVAGANAQETLGTPKWGADDQAGASNTQTPDKALQAGQLITEGKVYPLARTYEAEMPLFGSRVFAIRGTGGLAGGPVGSNKVIWNDDFLATEIGQVGTQFDGLGHIGIHDDEEGGTFYGGRKVEDVNSSYGLKQLGVENVKPFFTRGVLVDLEGYKGRMLDAGYEVTVEDITGALGKQGIDPESISEGDVVLLHTGWGSLWKQDNARFTGGEPGIGVEAAKWLAQKGVAVVGADTWAVEVVPNPDANLAFPVHQELITRNGIFLLENAATERLKEAGVNEFAFAFAPMPIKGGTGAPGNAMAIK
jgi:kynurenine formamidase